MTTDEQQAREAAWWKFKAQPFRQAAHGALFNAGWDARGEYERNQPVSDAEVEAAAKAIAPFVPDGNWRTDLAAKEAARAALTVARSGS